MMPSFQLSRFQLLQIDFLMVTYIRMMSHMHAFFFLGLFFGWIKATSSLKPLNPDKPGEEYIEYS